MQSLFALLTEMQDMEKELIALKEENQLLKSKLNEIFKLF